MANMSTRRVARIGIPGGQGPPGTNGTDGANGTNGADGANGAQGIPGPNSGRITHVTYYVATDGDDAADGTTPYNAVATVAAAQALLGSKRGAIQLLAPSAENYFVTGASGIVLASEGQLLLGDGFGTKIDGSGVTSGGAVITVGRSRCVVRDLFVANVPANKVGVRVSIVVGSSNENSVIENILVNANGVNAVAFGIGDDTNHDVSEIMIIGCASGGNTTSSVHMIVGNGTTGNVLDIVNIGGQSQGNQYGLILDGGAIYSQGLSFQASSAFDIWFRNTALGACVVSGGRSENPNRFVKSSFGTQATCVCEVSNYSVLNLQNTDGQAVQILSGPITFRNVALQGATGKSPQYWTTTGLRYTDGPTLDTIDLHGCASDHVHPLRSDYSRPGKNVHSTGMRWIADLSEQMETRRNQPCGIRRQNVTSSTAYTLDPKSFDDIEVRLGADAGVFTLANGITGQVVNVTFEQDGAGGRLFTWPTNVAFDGGSAPAWVGTSRNRQKVALAWSGSYWEQRGAVTNTVPPTPVATPIDEEFTSGYPFALAAPWEHLPGGGSIGVSGGVAVCTSLGYVGDVDSTDGGMWRTGGGAGAVVETGIANATITATFLWQEGEGIIAHYLDEQTWIGCCLSNLSGSGGVYVTLCARGATLPYGHVVLSAGVPLVAGSTYTLKVQCTATGLVLTLDSGTPVVADWGPSYSAAVAKFGDLTKHGFVLANRAAQCTRFTVT